MTKRLLTLTLATGLTIVAAPKIKKADVPLVNPEGRTLSMVEGKLSSVYIRPGTSTNITLGANEDIAGTFYGGYDEHNPPLSLLYLTGEKHDLSVEPHKAGFSTDLTVITNKTNRYHLMLVPADKDHPADSIVFLQPTDTAELQRVAAPADLVPASMASLGTEQVEQLKLLNARIDKLVDLMTVNVNVSKKANEQSRNDGDWKHDYTFSRLKMPFRMTDIETNGVLTKIHTDKGDDGAVYAMKAGKKKTLEHTAINKDFDPATHTWTIYARVDRGCLVLGASQSCFERLKD